ncbi:MAG: (d)CMP kinase [Firmicutes bacterium]|nr:(d)CMP kinase [Bacillota bacterium]MBR6799779.1 (d)CMP kinase [Bacillota bacterium]
MKEVFRIAIDGPSGAGKSTIAKLVAKKLGIDYIDTGAMYRAVGYKMNREGVPFEECDELKAMLDATDIDFVSGDIILDGQIVNTLIRTSEVSQMASKCSALPMVREKLVEIQRNMGSRKSVIMDGRDIGTNVLKDAEYKFFLTASAEERAERRHKELIEKGEEITFEEVLRDIQARDHNDMTRALNPLRKADDALEVDSTGMDIDQVTEAILKEIK